MRLPSGPIVSATMLAGLPDRLRLARPSSNGTGASAAAGLFDETGRELALCTEADLHNAVEGAIRLAAVHGVSPHRCVLAVTGRASLPIVQSAVLARFPIVCTTSAPFGPAVRLARAANLSLFGFVRCGGFNVYTGPERIEGMPPLERPHLPLPASDARRPARSEVGPLGLEPSLPA